VEYFPERREEAWASGLRQYHLPTRCMQHSENHLTDQGSGVRGRRASPSSGKTWMAPHPLQTIVRPGGGAHGAHLGQRATSCPSSGIS
jgi:hypothetical protein